MNLLSFHGSKRTSFFLYKFVKIENKPLDFRVIVHQINHECIMAHVNRNTVWLITVIKGQNNKFQVLLKISKFFFHHLNHKQKKNQSIFYREKRINSFLFLTYCFTQKNFNAVVKWPNRRKKHAHFARKKRNDHWMPICENVHKKKVQLKSAKKMMKTIHRNAAPIHIIIKPNHQKNNAFAQRPFYFFFFFNLKKYVFLIPLIDYMKYEY